MQLKKFFLDLFFPKHCIVCEKLGKSLCARCRDSVPIRETDLCPVCERTETYLGRICGACEIKNKTFFLDGLFVSSHYKHPVLKQAIYSFKYSRLSSLDQPLSKILGEKLKKYPEIFNDFCLVPVPLHPNKERSRGFNQSALLGKNIEKNFKKEHWKINIEPALLTRVRDNEPQMKMTETKERKENIKGCFKINNLFLSKLPEKILLLDDVCTTGSTLNECAKVFKKKGVKVVWGIVLARQKT